MHGLSKATGGLICQKVDCKDDTRMKISKLAHFQNCKKKKRRRGQINFLEKGDIIVHINAVKTKSRSFFLPHLYCSIKYFKFYSISQITLWATVHPSALLICSWVRRLFGAEVQSCSSVWVWLLTASPQGSRSPVVT